MKLSIVPVKVSATLRSVAQISCRTVFIISMRIARGAHQHAPRCRTRNRVRHPRFRRYRLLQSLVFHVGHNSDDFKPRVRLSVGKFFKLQSGYACRWGLRRRNTCAEKSG